jgi:hypothetical protein
MKNTLFLLAILSVILSGCSTNYKTLTNQAYLTDNSHGMLDRHKYYQNDSLNLTVEIPWDDANYSTFELDYFLPRNRQRHVLALTKVDPKKDFILYMDSWNIIVLKKSKINLASFRSYNVDDTTIINYTPLKSAKQIFRKTTIENKNKLLVKNDMIPFGKEYISVVSYDQNESKGGYAGIDISDPDDIYFFGEDYLRTLQIAKKTAHYINTQKRFVNVNPFTRLDEYFKYGKYNNYRAAALGADKSSQYHRIEDQQMYEQALATYYSFSHEEHKSDSLWAKLRQQTHDSIYKQAGTIDDLLKRADSTQIVMFNEAHNCPQHRYLVGTLLEKFYQKGFRYLGLEAFYNDSLLIKKGYPTSGNGFYLREPVFANLVREAHKMGFKVFEYDSFSNNREVDQAKNIYDKTLSKDHKAKVLILAGYEHIPKSKMAGKLETISGIKPLTIDQTYSYLNHLNNDTKSDKAYIIQDQYLKNKSDVDIRLWNDLIIKNNCFSLRDSKSVKINVPDSVINNATIICIYNKNEYKYSDKNIAIPVAVQVLNNKEISVELSLCSGDYVILFLDDYGTVLSEESRQINQIY